MKISIITVCFNSEKTIEKTLKSVLDQDWHNIEHIVIDGGSNDGTVAILERFRPHLACVVMEPDKGIYDAMNKGLSRATGDVICFLNSDDFYNKNDVLTRVANKIQKNGVDAVFGDVAFFNEGNPDYLVRHYRSGSFHAGRLSWGWMPAHPALFMRREVYNKLTGFDDTYRIAGDFELIARAFTKLTLRYEYIPSILVSMQTGGASTSPGIRGRIRHNLELLRACRDNGISTNIFKLLCRYPLKLFEKIQRG